MVNFYPAIKFSLSTAATALIVVATAPLASATPATEAPCTRTDKIVTCVWDQPGSYNWQVPDGVASVSLDIYGAQGGSTKKEGTSTEKAHGGAGGQTSVSDLKIEAGLQQLQLNVGGQGTSVKDQPSGGVGGGGNGSTLSDRTGAGGGGASEALVYYQSAGGPIIAGGGGGAGYIQGGNGDGGVGGGTIAGSAAQTNFGGGGGATEKIKAGKTIPVPGIGHTYPFVCAKGEDGALGFGGNAQSCISGSGGGGGGWAGGAGGTAGRGGGGGTGHIDDSLTGYFAHAQMSEGTNDGNGKIVVTYTVASETN